MRQLTLSQRGRTEYVYDRDARKSIFLTPCDRDLFLRVHMVKPPQCPPPRRTGPPLDYPSASGGEQADAGGGGGSLTGWV